MCMIAWCPAGVPVNQEMLEDGAMVNPDGVGIMWADRGRLEIRRSLEMKRMWEFIREVPADTGFAVHCRIATHGGINKRNCHPFKVTPDIYLMHNGILPLKDANNIESDTALFAKRVLRPILLENSRLYESTAFINLLRLAGGDYNKFLLLNSDGQVVIVNEKGGFWKEGCWYSSRPFPMQTTTISGKWVKDEKTGTYLPASSATAPINASYATRNAYAHYGDWPVEGEDEYGEPTEEDNKLYQEWLAKNAAINSDDVEDEELTDQQIFMNKLRTVLKEEEVYQPATTKLARRVSQADLIPGYY